MGPHVGLSASPRDSLGNYSAVPAFRGWAEVLVELDIRAEPQSLNGCRTATVGSSATKRTIRMSRFRTCRGSAVLVPSRNLGTAVVRSVSVTAEGKSVEQSVDRHASAREIFVVAADGTMLNIGNLPPSDTKRWVRRRKSYVVAAVKGGLLSLDEAYRRYSLTPEEFQGWENQARLHAAERWRR